MKFVTEVGPYLKESDNILQDVRYEEGVYKKFKKKISKL